MATQVSDTGGKPKARGSADELAVIAQRAQAFTNASGTAIALTEGSTDEIICRARSGSSAPDVGTALRVEGSFTGLCIQSGKELRCDDTETDTRVDTAATRALGIRSMVVTPIKDENKVAGVLLVLAPTAHAFTITHVAVLKTMADQISTLLQKERRAREEGSQPEAATRPNQPVAMPKPVAAVPAPAPTPPPVVIKPTATAAAVARAAFPVVSKVEPIKAAPVVEEAAVAIAPKREEKRAEFKADLRPSFGTLEAVAGEQQKKAPVNRLAILGVVAALALAAAGTFAYRRFRQPAPPLPPHAQETPASVPGQPTAPGAAAPANGQPATPATGAATAASNAPAPTVVAAAAPKPAADRKASETASRREDNTANRTAVADTKATPAAVELAGGQSRINAPPAGQSGSPDVMPVLSVGGGNTAGALGSLAKPSASSTPSMISQSELEPLAVLKRVTPVYPAIAKVRRLSGSVIVEGLVGKDGKISNLKFVSGPPVFHDAAFDAVRQWLFKPAKLNGQPIEQSTQIRVDFKP
jgi:TonB family protein